MELCGNIMANNSGLVLNCTVTVPALAPAATVQSVTMQTSPTVTGVQELQVPLTENWIATDVYILTAANGGTITQPIVTMDKNRGRTLVQTPPLAAMLITSNTRPRFSPMPIGFEGGSIIRMFTTTTTLAVGAENIKFSVAISIE